MGRASFPRSTWGIRLAVLLLAGLAATAGCQKTDDLLEPSGGDSGALHAVYRSTEEFLRNPIVMDGQAVEKEWARGTVPYQHIRVSTEEGVGSSPAPKYVSMKAVYTDREIFFLIRWSDAAVDALKDAMIYVGEPLADSLSACPPALASERSWLRNPDGEYEEDRFTIAFEAETAGNRLGTFEDLGCQVACHVNESPRFGRLEFGRLDVWQWLASRTNPVRDLFDMADNPENALYGIPGYLDDLLSDPYAGLSADPGTPSYRANFAEESDVPLYIYRDRDDPFSHPLDPERCWSQFGEKCRKNNGVEMSYIWREQIEIHYETFGPCDTVLVNPFPIGTEPHKWRPGDLVTGWILTYPSGSRADVHGKAGYEEGVWTLEVGRRLDTNDPLHDVIFVPGSGKTYIFTIAVMDNSVAEHLGSQPQMLVFDPPTGKR